MKAKNVSPLGLPQLLLSATLLVASGNTWAASCCGGGSGSALMLSKSAQQLIDLSLDVETYHGFWNDAGARQQDPQGSSLAQYRLNLGYAYRFNAHWQASLVMPWVVNDTEYSGVSSTNNGLGDVSATLWYEVFENITCVWKVNELADLKPSIYLGLGVVLPTGESAYGDEARTSFDVTGRGFYRVDTHLMLEKTLYPWTVTLQGSYGRYLERPINQEYGKAVAPYDKRLGDRRFLSTSLGYTWFDEDANTLTLTGAVADLREGSGTLNGATDPLAQMKKQSASATLAYATASQDWIIKGIVNHALRDDHRGKRFPITDVFTLEVSYVFD